MVPILIGALCGLAMVLITLGTFRSWPERKNTPDVTVIVCARDEEENLLDCLMSLATQDYPLHRYQLILVNHLSKDRTGEILDTFAESSPVTTTVIHIQEKDPVLRGKVQALAEAMKYVETEFVLLTDADCITPETWIKTLVSRFTKEVVAVGGMVSVGPDEDPVRSGVGGLQNVDHRYYMGLVGGLSGIAGFFLDRNLKKTDNGKVNTFFHPKFVSGNNLGFRYSAYKATGGYEAIPGSLIEDYDLLKRMVSATGGHLAFLLEPEARITTKPVPTLRDVWRQKRRWAKATSTPDALSYFLYLLVFSSRVVLPWYLIYQPVDALLGLMLTGLGSMIVIRRVNKITNLRIRMRDILYHEIYQVFLNHALLLATLVRWPVLWKGERYPRKRK